MPKLKPGLALLSNIGAWVMIGVDIVLTGILAGPFGLFLLGFVTVVWWRSVLRQRVRPTLLADLLQASMASAWTVLNGLISRSFGMCLFAYVYMLCVLCANRPAESDE